MKTVSNAFAAILIAISSTSAMAEGGKFYTAIDLGQTKAVDILGCPFDSNPFVAAYSCKDTASAVRIAGGYQFSPTFGLELSYSDIGMIEASGTLVTGVDGLNSLTYKLNGYALHATGTLPINDSFSLFGKFGIARTSAKESVRSTPGCTGPECIQDNTYTSTKASFGVGAKYAFSDQVDFRIQYDKFGMMGDSNVGRARFDLLSAGAVYKF